MVNNNELVMRFENNNSRPLILIFDPPCIDFTLMQDEFLLLKIENLPMIDNVFLNQIKIRHELDYINVDINHNSKTRLTIIIDGKEQIIWGF
jgi:hypothetical protein